MLRLVINGRAAECREGSTLLDALQAAGARVPTLCHDTRLAPCGGCRLCLVHVRDQERPVAACTTPAIDGMEVETHTPEIEALRRTQLALLARGYPAEAVRRDPDKEFHAYLRQYELESELHRHADGGKLDTSHPYIHVDMSQCVTCYRCVRICDELQGQFAWRAWHRGDRTQMRPDGPSLLESSCVSCGACVDTCPTGAIEDRSRLDLGAATRWVRTTCPYCGTGCEMSVGTRDGHIVDVRPVADAPVSRGHLCVKGRYAFGFASAADRVTEPMIRRRDGWHAVSWDEAIGYVAGEFQRVRSQHGAGSVGVLGSARATNEDNYVAQKFARIVLDTNNVDCCARVCHAPSAAALSRMLGTGAATNSFDDVERARTILVWGANPTENHPIIGARIKRAARAGAQLIVVDPRRTELARYAACHLAPLPGTDVPLLAALAHTIVHEHLCDQSFLSARVDGLEPFVESLAVWTPERAAAVTGVDADLIRQAARLYATGAPSMSMHGLGLTEHVQGTDAVLALVNLALLTGNLGRPGSGVNPLRGQNNVQGAAQMGCDPSRLTGGTSLAAGHQRFGEIWQAALTDVTGLRLPDMLEAAIDGRFKALWAIGYDVLFTNPQASQTRRALAALDLLVVQDLFLTETVRELAHVFLPACSSFEKDGTFMNAERRIQRVRPAIQPAGQSRPDWAIICDVAKHMGQGGTFAYSNAEAIWDEVRRVWPDVAGISYARLEREGLRWPCPSEDHPGTDILHRDTFTHGTRARLEPIVFEPTPERVDAAFPFLLTTGRTLYQFNAGTMTGRTPNNVLRPTDVLEMAPADADRLALHEGDAVRLASRYGTATLPLRVAEGVKPGMLFATFHTREVFLNQVTGPNRDRATGAPEYKVTAVRVERVGPS
ncbi:MAG: formate dehydrogenase subunit alpha [Vicinamibacteria bacterium]|nr:formate dehydrogenase subunit alpha [Vicinamibacteria bacterium]